MLNFIKNATLLPALLLSAFLLPGCSPNGIDAVPLDADLLSSYQQIAHPDNAQPASEEIDCYLDYSDGMKDKIGGDKVFYNVLKDGLGPFEKNNKVHYYRVGAADKPVLIGDTSEFRNTNNYTDKVSKLEGALKEIVQHKNRTAIFITDFEKIVGNGIAGNPGADSKTLRNKDNSAWGTKYFADWLNAGNTIDIFPTPCTVNKQLNYIYTFVFTPASVVKNEQAMQASILNYMLGHVANKPLSYSAGNFKIAQQKKADETGNANDNVIVMENITSTKDKGFEYYSFTSDDLVNFNTDETQKGDRRIINKVLVENQNEAFESVEYDLKVTDISESILDYYTVKEQAPPEVDTSKEDGSEAIVANKPLSFNYKAGPAVTDVFERPVYNTKNKELGIKLNPEFAGVPATTLYQVDVVLKSAKLRDFSGDDPLLRLTYSAGPDDFIDPLGKSIKDAMTSVANGAAGNVLYTFYIKITK